MTSWKTYKFTDFLEVNPKVTLKAKETYSFIEMKDLDEGQRNAYPSQERTLAGGARFSEGDTLFARITPCLENGKICQAKGLQNGVGFGSTEFHVFRERKDISDKDFIFYLSRWEEVRRYAELHLVGTSGRQRVPKDVFEKLELSFPDLPTQRRIAEILSALDDKIELNCRMNQTLEQMAQTLFRQYFVDGIDEENLPEGWEVGVFTNLIEFSNGYAFKSKELLDADNGESLHVFKMAHIKKGGGLNSNCTKSYFDKSKSNNLSRYILKKGDLLMCMTDMKDNVALLGHTALMNEDDKFIVNQRVGLIRAKNNLGINYPYLYLLTNSHSFLQNLRSRANSGVQVNLSTSEIKETEVIIPPKEINVKFDLVVTPLFEKIFQVTKENQSLSTLRDTLLSKLMSGEIDVMQSKLSEQHEPVLS